MSSLDELRARVLASMKKMEEIELEEGEVTAPPPLVHSAPTPAPAPVNNRVDPPVIVQLGRGKGQPPHSGEQRLPYGAERNDVLAYGGRGGYIDGGRRQGGAQGKGQRGQGRSNTRNSGRGGGWANPRGHAGGYEDEYDDTGSRLLNQQRGAPPLSIEEMARLLVQHAPVLAQLTPVPDPYALYGEPAPLPYDSTPFPYPMDHNMAPQAPAFDHQVSDQIPSFASFFQQQQLPPQPPQTDAAKFLSLMAMQFSTIPPQDSVSACPDPVLLPSAASAEPEAEADMEVEPAQTPGRIILSTPRALSSSASGAAAAAPRPQKPAAVKAPAPPRPTAVKAPALTEAAPKRSTSTAPVKSSEAAAVPITKATLQKPPSTRTAPNESSLVILLDSASESEASDAETNRPTTVTSATVPAPAPMSAKPAATASELARLRQLIAEKEKQLEAKKRPAEEERDANGTRRQKPAAAPSSATSAPLQPESPISAGTSPPTNGITSPVPDTVDLVRTSHSVTDVAAGGRAASVRNLNSSSSGMVDPPYVVSGVTSYNPLALAAAAAGYPYPGTSSSVPASAATSAPTPSPAPAAPVEGVNIITSSPHQAHASIDVPALTRTPTSAAPPAIQPTPLSAATTSIFAAATPAAPPPIAERKSPAPVVVPTPAAAAAVPPRPVRDLGEAVRAVIGLSPIDPIRAKFVLTHIAPAVAQARLARAEYDKAVDDLATLEQSANEPGRMERLAVVRGEVYERLEALQTFDKSLVDLVFEFRLQADLRMLRAEQEIPISVPVINTLRPFLECTTPVPSSVPGKFELVKITPESLAITASTFPGSASSGAPRAAAAQPTGRAGRTRERDAMLGDDPKPPVPVQTQTTVVKEKESTQSTHPVRVHPERTPESLQHATKEAEKKEKEKKCEVTKGAEQRNREVVMREATQAVEVLTPPISALELVTELDRDAHCSGVLDVCLSPFARLNMWSAERNRKEEEEMNERASTLAYTRAPIMHATGLPSDYNSPLLCLRSYRLQSIFPASRLAATHCVRLDPRVTICRFEVSGACNDPACEHQHMRDVLLTGDAIAADYASYVPLLAPASSAATPEKLLGAARTAITKASKRDVEALLNAVLAQLQALRSDHRLILAGRAPLPVRETRKKQRRHQDDEEGRRKAEREKKEASDSDSEEVVDAEGYMALTASTDGIEFQRNIAAEARYWQSNVPSDFESMLASSPHDIDLWLRFAKELGASDDGLRVLARGLESNKSSTDLWLAYLCLYLRLRGWQPEVAKLAIDATRFTSGEIRLVRLSAYLARTVQATVTELLTAAKSMTQDERDSAKKVLLLLTAAEALVSQGSHCAAQRLLQAAALHHTATGGVAGEDVLCAACTPLAQPEAVLLLLCACHLALHGRLPLFPSGSPSLFIVPWPADVPAPVVSLVDSAIAMEGLSSGASAASSALWANAIAMYRRLGRTVEARQLAARATAAAPGVASRWVLRAAVEAHEPALAVLVEASKADPTNGNLYALHACTLSLQCDVSANEVARTLASSVTVHSQPLVAPSEQPRAAFLRALSLDSDLAPLPRASASVVDQDPTLWLCFGLYEALRGADSEQVRAVFARALAQLAPGAARRLVRREYLCWVASRPSLRSRSVFAELERIVIGERDGLSLVLHFVSVASARFSASEALELYERTAHALGEYSAMAILSLRCIESSMQSQALDRLRQLVARAASRSPYELSIWFALARVAALYRKDSMMLQARAALERAHPRFVAILDNAPPHHGATGK